MKNSKIYNGLPSDAYTDKNFWIKECETIFEDNWIFAGFAHEFKNIGDVLPIQLGSKPILLLKNKKEEIVAFHNVCSHRCLKLIDQKKKYWQNN